MITHNDSFSPYSPHSPSSNDRRDYRRSQDETAPLILTVGILVVFGLAFYILVTRFHIRPVQLVEAGVYLLCLVAAGFAIIHHLRTFKEKREKAWPQPEIHVSTLKHEKYVQEAFSREAIVLGYDNHKKPWLWTDETRRGQALLLGQSGSGKTTLLTNIISQDVHRFLGPPDRRRRMPMIIFDGKGDQQFLDNLLYEIEAAGRMHQLRILDPSRPDISVRYNPLYIKEDDSYQEHVNFIFESFGLSNDFFKGHQANYFSDVVRVLVHTGKRFNIYDVLVVALDEQVLREQIAAAMTRAEDLSSLSTQKKLNLRMSVQNLRQSLEDRERLPKIQGLVNELMTFLEDELSLITGPYDDLLTLDEVIDQELILFVSLNTNRNARAVTALGRMLLQNLQLMVGKRYQRGPGRTGEELPMLSVVLDEFAPFAYENFAQILQTARGSNVAFLFSLQSISQLDAVSRSFRNEVSSAPNTIMLMRTWDEETSRYFANASSRIAAERRSEAVEKRGIFQQKYERTGKGNVTEIKETRVSEEHIKNQPTGQMEILMSHHRFGAVCSHLHVRRLLERRLASFKPILFPYLESLNSRSDGANLRFKDPVLIGRNRISGRGKRGGRS
jgi:Type IV secretory system Conjugative DNA transfer